MSISADGKFQLENPRTLHSVISLWDQETRDQAIMLVLPDTLRPKYYLQDKGGKMKRDAARDERQMQRFEFLSRKLVSADRDRQNTDVSSYMSVGVSRNRAEKEVDDKLLAPLRKNDKLQEEFLNRVLAIKMERQPKIEVIKRLKADAVVPLSARRPSFLESRNQMLKQVTRRRSTLMEEKESELADRLREINQKESGEVDMEADHRQLAKLAKRKIATEWLTIIANLKRLKILHDVVGRSRAAERIHEGEWRSALIIQNCWRKFSRSSTSVAASRKLLSRSRNMARQILKKRQDACAIIIDFLSTDALGVRTAISAFLRNVKHCQWIFSGMRIITQHRISMLEELFDRALDIIYYHAGIIFSGKPSLAVDPFKLDSMMLGTDPLCIRRMLTLDFHSHLRNMQSANEAVFAALKATRRERMAGKWPPDTQLRASVLSRLLSDKRKAHHYKMSTKFVVRSELPKMKEADVRAFIQTGKDPLVDHVRKMEDGPNQMKELITLTTRKKAMTRPLLLLRSLDPNDLVQCVFEVVEKTFEAKRNKVKATHKQKVMVEKRKKFGAADSGALTPSGASSAGGQKKGYNRSASASTNNDVIASAPTSMPKIQTRTVATVKDSTSPRKLLSTQASAASVLSEGDGCSVGSDDMGHAFPHSLSEEDLALDMRPATPPKSQKPSSTRPKRR